MEVLSSRTIVYPSDVPAALRFWDDVVGLARYREYGHGGTITGVVYFLGGGFLEVSSAGSPAGEVGAAVALWLQVRDVDAEHRRLVDAGATIVEAPADMPWGLREMWLAGPDDLRLCLVQVPDDHPLRRRV